MDGAGNAYVTGRHDLDELPDDRRRLRHDLQRRLVDAFVTKLTASGTALVYSTYLGGSGDDDGRRHRGGRRRQRLRDRATASTDFPTTAGAFDTTYNGGFGTPS